MKKQNSKTKTAITSNGVLADSLKLRAKEFKRVMRDWRGDVKIFDKAIKRATKEKDFGHAQYATGAKDRLEDCIRHMEEVLNFR